MTFGFDHLFGLFALLSVIPLIILYLIKPKPVKLSIPSLMFFIAHSKVSKKNKILRYFQNELLFYIQLFTLLLLALAIAQPYLIQKKDISSEHKIFVLDVSASSQVLENGKTRFALSQEKIKAFANSDKNTLILAKNMPIVALQDAKKADLLSFIQQLQPSEEETNLGDAIILAGELVKNKGRVIVFSDFISTKGMTPERAKNTLEGKGIHVDFISTVLGPRSNVGIINLFIDDTLTNIYVKNYDPVPHDVPVLLNNQKITSMSIKPGNTEIHSFPTVKGVSEVRIDIADDFPPDNKLVLTTPDDPTIRVLYITNNPSKFIQAALGSYDHIKVTLAQPPIIPKEQYDLYLIQNVNIQTLLPGTFEELAQRVHDHGGSVIVHVQPNSASLDYKQLELLHITNTTTGGLILTEQSNRFTTGIDFGTLKKTYQGRLAPSTLSIASAVNSTVLALREYGKGKIFYYGIPEEDSEFKINPDYPVFWVNLLKYLKGQRDLRDINLKTGTTFLDDKNNQLVLDKIGIYNLPGQRIAVNLLSDKESAINPQKPSTDVISHYQLETIQDTYKQEFYWMLLLLAFLLILFETIYLKIRGEV